MVLNDKKSGLKYLLNHIPESYRLFVFRFDVYNDVCRLIFALLFLFFLFRFRIPLSRNFINCPERAGPFSIPSVPGLSVSPCARIVLKTRILRNTSRLPVTTDRVTYSVAKFSCRTSGFGELVN